MVMIFIPAEAAHGLLEKLRSGEADMVIGDRLSNGTYFDENKRPFHDFGNNLVKNTITYLYKTKIRDVMTGYRGFNRILSKASYYEFWFSNRNRIDDSCFR